MLINDAGVVLRDDLTDPAVLERHLAVNLYRTYTVTPGFSPVVPAPAGHRQHPLVNALAPFRS